MSAWENYHLEWSPDPLSVTVPSWQDITAFALSRSGPPIFCQTGTPPMGTAGQYATMSVDLDNTDGRFTFGNTSSPLSPNWKPGRRIRLYETITGRRFDLFTGYMLAPENPDFADKGVDQVVTLNAVDRLGWINGGRRFVSTLAEHIRFNGGSILHTHYPLGEPATATVATGASGGGFEPLLTLDPTCAGFSGAAGVTGDDLTSPQFTDLTPKITTTSGGLHGAGSLVPLANALPFDNTQVMTFLAWVYPTLSAATLSDVVQFIGSSGSINFGIDNIAKAWNLGPLFASWGSFAGTDGPSVMYNQWQLVGFRLRLGGVCEIWLNGQATTMTFGGAAPPSTILTDITFAPLGGFTGRIAHVQVYVSSGSSDYSMAAFTAQAATGMTGMYGQFAGDRIRTLAQYAGVPATELSLIQQGTAVMQKASLAGLSPYAAMQTAETTERGRLRTSGAGLIVFDPRTRRYNS